MDNKADYGAALETLIGYTYIKYKGCLIERSSYGYIWKLTLYSTLEGVQGSIDQHFQRLKNTIK